jgi:hypothetical protein
MATKTFHGLQNSPECCADNDLAMFWRPVISMILSFSSIELVESKCPGPLEFMCTRAFAKAYKVTIHANLSLQSILFICYQLCNFFFERKTAREAPAVVLYKYIKKRTSVHNRTENREPKHKLATVQLETILQA